MESIAKALFVALLVCVCLGRSLESDTFSHQGMMQVAKKKVIAKDMLYILKTIVFNAKFGDYPDIKDEEGEGMLKKGMYITDLDVVHIEFDAKSLENSLHLNKETKIISLTSTAPVLKYTFAFKWKAVVFGAHVGYGVGNATFTSTKMMASYGIKKVENPVEFSFKAEISSVTGVNSLTPGLMNWLNGKFKDVVHPALIHAINFNRDFIAEYMHKVFIKMERKISSEHVLKYINEVVDVDESGDSILYAFKTSLFVKDENVGVVSEQYPIEPSLLKKDMGFYSSPQLIPLTINVHGKLKICNGEFNMSTIGLTGTVKDFFEPIPELALNYQGEEKVKMDCEYAFEKVTELPNFMLILPAKCQFKFKETDKTLLTVKAYIKMKYTPVVLTENNKLYGAKLSNCVINKTISEPQSISIGFFLMRILQQFANVRYEGKTIEVPRLRFEPLRDYTEFDCENQQDHYASFYDDTPL